MKQKSYVAILSIVAAAAAIILVAWLLTRDTSLSRLQQTGIIRIGYAIEAPYAFLIPGEVVTGESPEIAKRMVSRLGIRQIEWRQIEFSSLIDELQSGRIDVIASGMFITPARAQQVNFSEPTFHVRQGLLVARGNPQRIHSYQQALTQKSIKFAVLAGSVEEKLLQQIGIPENQRLVVPDALTGEVAVESGRADGLALSSPTIQWMALQGQMEKSEAAQPFEQPAQAAQERLGYGAFAFRKTDIQLLNSWNSVQKKYLGSPEHLKLIAGFGFSSAELPGAITAKEIASP
jgi:polar amino acid transport system substrate-binding protein